jgi:Domain of unknown function (DUF6487)
VFGGRVRAKGRAPRAPPNPSADLIHVDEIVFCPSCGVMNALARGSCRECRASLTARASTPASPPPARQERVRICPRCRRGNPEDAEACFDCGGRFTRWAERPRETPEVPPDPLPCPGCGTEMETGVMFLQNSSFWGQVLADGPRNPAVFRRHEARRDETVVRPGEKVQAQRCPACNSVWIAPPPPSREASW